MSQDRDRQRRMRWPTRNEAEIRSELAEETAFHLDMRTAELVAEGMTAAAARAQAEHEFGDVEASSRSIALRATRSERRRRRAEWLRDAVQDGRLAVRTLGRSRGFTMVAVLTLALGIGANTAIFSVVDGVLLRPLPYAQQERLVAGPWYLRAEYEIARERAQSFEQLAMHQGGLGFSISGDVEPERVVGARVSANFFEMLGANPLLGRTFEAAEERPGRSEVAILSHGFWRQRYGGRRDIVGRSIVVDGVTHTVIGVMPASFSFPAGQAALWLPQVLDPNQAGMYWGVSGGRSFGRLRAGVAPSQVQAELRGLGETMRLGNILWTPNAPYRANDTVVPLREAVVGDIAPMLLLLLGAVGLVLLIACANVGNLTLARGLARERDLAVRAALGAGRGRIVRQLLAESLVLAVIGGLAGVLVAKLSLGALVALLPADTPRLAEVTLDGRVLVFAGLAIVVTGALFGLFPAWRLTRGALHDTLRGGGRGGTGDVGRRRLSGALVAGEIALAFVLVIGAGLLIRSLHNLQTVDPGFRVERVVSARVSPPESLYRDAAPRRALYGQVLERLAATPGVSVLAATQQLPFEPEVSMTAAAIEGITTDPNELPMFEFRAVTPDFFRALGIDVRQGRAFTDADQPGALPVAIVDERAAREFWGDASPVGGRIGRPWMNEWLSIVGVVGGVKNRDLAADEGNAAIYVPFAQQPSVSATLVMRAETDIAQLARAVREAVAQADPGVPVGEIRTLASLVRASVADSRAATLLLTGFAALALLLGAIGVYGLLAYTVAQRAREMGVRVALGARAADVLRLVLRDGATIAAIGIAIGIVAALALTRSMRSLLFQVEATDIGTYVVATLVLGLVALLAAVLPARRATRVDPIEVLRGD